MPAPAPANPASVITVATVKNEPLPAVQSSISPAPVPQPPVTKPEVLETPAKLASIAPSVPIPTPTPERSAKPRVGWIIQVGALPDEKEARQRLETAQSKAKDILGRADPFTERIEKGDKVLFRARFAGLEKNQAEAACKHLKRSDIPCMLLKN